MNTIATLFVIATAIYGVKSGLVGDTVNAVSDIRSNVDLKCDRTVEESIHDENYPTPDKCTKIDGELTMWCKCKLHYRRCITSYISLFAVKNKFYPWIKAATQDCRIVTVISID